MPKTRTPDLLIDLNGHFRSGSLGARTVKAMAKTHEDIAQRLSTHVLIDDQIDLPPGETPYLGLFNRSCTECGEGVTFAYHPHGTGWVVRACTPCAFPDGIAPFEVSIDVPSGVLVFANDMRSLVTLQGVDDSHEINRGSEMKRCTEDHAQEGMVHIYVGNSGPQLRIMQDGSIQVQDQGYRSSVPGTPLGHIDTSLWWICAMDEAEFLARCQETGETPEHFDVIRVQVSPGAWSFSVNYNQNHGRRILYTQARRTGALRGWTRPEDPFAQPATYEASHFWAVWKLRDSRSDRTMADWLEHGFCVGGNGLGWGKGRLRHHGDDRPAFPYDMVITPQVGPLPTDGIPAFDASLLYGHRRDGIYPMSCGQFSNTAACAPMDIDIHWLAAALVVFQGLARAPQVLSHRSALEHAGQITCVGRTLAILNMIAEQGNRWPELTQVFEDMAPVWAILNTPAPPDTSFLGRLLARAS